MEAMRIIGIVHFKNVIIKYFRMNKNLDFFIKRVPRMSSRSLQETLKNLTHLHLKKV